MRRTHELIQERGIPGGFVMPGFYGATREGQVKLLDRGGGDISGSILAKCLDADLYENWTDVSGFLSADPHIVENPQPISRITYAELRELSYMGASVLHEGGGLPRYGGRDSHRRAQHQPPRGRGHHHLRPRGLRGG